MRSKKLILTIFKSLLKKAPASLFAEAIDKYMHTVRRGLDDAKVKPKDAKPPTREEEEKFYKMLMHSDRMSVRQFLLS